MQQIYKKFDKSLLPALPRLTFPGRIHTLLTEAEAARAVDYLLTRPLVGIDTETRPTFHRGAMRNVALLQVATEDTAFLFRLCRTGLTDSIVRLLGDTGTRKVGLSLKDDLHNLRRTRPFEPGGFIEIQAEARQLGIEDMSLQKLYANLLGKRIAKNQQLSNWEADALTPAQQQYAAIDAWACLHLHERVARLMASHDFQLVGTDTGEEAPATGHPATQTQAQANTPLP